MLKCQSRTFTRKMCDEWQKKTVEFNFSYSAQLNVMLSAAVSNIVNGIIKTDFMFYTF